MVERRTALVTGASSGIGTAFAHLLADEGYDLVLTARREDRLASLCVDLEKANGIRAQYVVADLADPDGPQAVFDFTQGQKIDVDLLVNNAGFGTFKPFRDIDDGRNNAMIQVLISSLTELTRLYLRPMLDRDSGGILNVASIGAEIPADNIAVYAASKAYVVQFTNCLSMELMGSGVTTSVLLPGATQTEFNDVAGLKTNKALQAITMGAGETAAIGYRGWKKGKVKIIAGCLNRFQVCLMKILPRCCVKKMIEMYTK